MSQVVVKVPVPPQTTAYRWMQELERRHPTFRLSTQRNRDVADRPRGVYGKLRPTRPGEYVLMNTTRLEVFAPDPMTLRWMQAELTVAMDCQCSRHAAPGVWRAPRTGPREGVPRPRP